MKPIRIATRTSKLALIQSHYAANLIKKIRPDAEISIVEISTKGDRDKSDFLYKSESAGFFTSEVEKALLDNRADLAVHSLKDLPTAITDGLTIAAILKRDNVADVLVALSGISSIADLPTGAIVGTSSLRRLAQVKHIRRDLNCVPLRGNVETRVNKVLSGQIDAAILAYAGLSRLGMTDKISAILPPEDFLPAPAQAALAIQIRTEDSDLVEIISELDDKPSRITAEAEREVLSAMHGGCSVPLGVYSYIQNNIITIHAIISDLDGIDLIKCSDSAPVNKSENCAKALAEKLVRAGGREILEQIKKQKDFCD